MKTSIRLPALLATALVSAALSACGGDGVNPMSAGVAGAASSPAPVAPQPVPPAAQAACRPAGKFTYTGSASQIAANNGQFAVVTVPTLPPAYANNRNFTAPNAPASSLVQQASGAFTTLASSAAATDCLGLDHGAVTEIQSSGTDVAIGRWNQAMDTDGNTYTSTQGVHYAVGTPLALTATSGTLACTQLLADTVASDNGGASGTLGATTATLDLGARTLDNLRLSLNVANTAYTLTYAQAPLNGTSKTGQLSIQSVVVGHDATQPLVAVGCAGSVPNAGGIGGVVVLACK
ncbi:TPA: hypothetical protein QDB18_000751 [Burkholderia vietnamiensis]|nr:hypothetical protein [Burkholderia vietnamiensis]